MKIKVRIKDRVEICCPLSIDHLTTYVSIEQEDWFEDEIKFVRHMMKPGMKVIDIGANLGLYTLAMAKRIGPNGRAWAFEPASTTASFLDESIVQNRLSNTHLIQAALSNTVGKTSLFSGPHSELNSLRRKPNFHSGYETVNSLTLDKCFKNYGWEDIDFVKIDTEGEEINVIEGGRDFFKTQSPLTMFELKDDKTINLHIIRYFKELGYSTYRLVPGLNILVPFDASDNIDPYWLNLFCCRSDRARLLEEQNLLFFNNPNHLTPPIDNRELWRNYLGEFVYAKNLMKNRFSDGDRQMTPGGSEYEAALNYYAIAHSQHIPPAIRYISLKKALRELTKLCGVMPTFSRLQTYARVLWEIGMRDHSIQILNKLIVMMTSEKQIYIDEPFIPASARFDFIDPGDEILRWCFTSFIEQREISHSFSSYYTGRDSLPNLEALPKLGFQGAEMERRRQLVRISSGLQIGPESNPLLSKGTMDNLNADFWLQDNAFIRN